MVNLSEFRKHVKDKSPAFVPLFKDESRYQVAWGGAGCVHPDTRIHTEHGLMRICDIDRPMRVLSWNAKDQRFQLSLSGGSFPKGRDYLYRVSTQRGEFQSSGHHLVLLSSGEYRRVDMLRPCDELSQAQSSPSQTIEEHCLKLSLSDDLHLKQTDVSSLARYADECRRYDPQPQEVGDYALFCEPSQGGAQEFDNSCSPSVEGHQGKSHPHSRLHLCVDHTCKTRCGVKEPCSGCVEADHGEASSFAHTLYSLQGIEQSQQKIVRHRKEELGVKDVREQQDLKVASFVSPINEYAILSCASLVMSIERVGFSEYWCMQVADTNNYVSEDGAIHHNSGKSHIVARRFLYRILKEQDCQHKFLIVRKVNRTLKRSVFTLFRNLIVKWGLYDQFDINNTDLTITYKVNGSQFMFTGMDDPEKLKSIEGVTGIWMEEATEFDQVDFEQLDLRLRGHTLYPKQIVLTLNPISDQHWIKKIFFDDPMQGVFTLHTTYLDNAFIDDEYKMVMENKKRTNPRYYNIYALGNWGTAEGLVFTNVEQRLIRPDEIAGLTCVQGLDFGYTNDPTAFNESYVDTKNKRIYVYDGFYEKGMSNDKIASQIKKLEAHKHKTTADSSEPKSIDYLASKGIKVEGAAKGKDSINAGIDFLSEFEIIVNAHLVEFMTEFLNYSWALDKKTGKPTNKPVDDFNHFIDSLRYAVEHLMKKGAYSWSGF